MSQQEDILKLLQGDPGSRTLGQLLQERTAAAHEIRELRRRIERLQSMRRKPSSPPDTTSPKPKAHRPPGALIRISDVCELLSVSRATIYRWVSQGAFPTPVRVNAGSVRWRADELEAWRDRL